MKEKVSLSLGGLSPFVDPRDLFLGARKLRPQPPELTPGHLVSPPLNTLEAKGLRRGTPCYAFIEDVHNPSIHFRRKYPSHGREASIGAEAQSSRRAFRAINHLVEMIQYPFR